MSFPAVILSIFSDPYITESHFNMGLIWILNFDFFLDHAAIIWRDY